jgi:hypothetical protein
MVFRRCSFYFTAPVEQRPPLLLLVFSSSFLFLPFATA